MPGWTTDVASAIAFATENPQKSVLFVQQNGVPQNEELKKLLISSEAESALSDKQKVTINMTTGADIAAQYGVQQAPAVVLLGPGGIPESQKAGKISKSELLSYIK
jgi:thioredoxin-like negative regulator of GroEL